MKPLQETLIIPGSISMTLQALMIAALAEGVSEISNLFINEEVLDFIHALRQLGLMLQLDEAARSCIVGGCDGQFPQRESTLHFSTSYHSFLFLLLACASSPGVYRLESESGVIPPKLDLGIKILSQQGVSFLTTQPFQLPLTMKGSEGLAGGEIEITTSGVETLISSLLIVAPFAKSPLYITVPGGTPEAPLELTGGMMSEFGVRVRRIHQSRYVIPVPQRYLARDYSLEPDLVLAAYFFAAAAITQGEVTISSFRREHPKQSAATILLYLEKMGCHIYENEQRLTVGGPTTLKGVNIDMRFFSDAVLALMAIAPFATSPLTITNILQSKKTQIERLCKEFEKISIKLEKGPDWVRVFPSEPQAGMVDAQADPEIGLALSVIGLRVNDIKIQGTDSLKTLFCRGGLKVFPPFT